MSITYMPFSAAVSVTQTSDFSEGKETLPV